MGNSCDATDVLTHVTSSTVVLLVHGIPNILNKCMLLALSETPNKVVSIYYFYSVKTHYRTLHPAQPTARIKSIIGRANKIHCNGSYKTTNNIHNGAKTKIGEPCNIDWNH
jgi:hypothetical protein